MRTWKQYVSTVCVVALNSLAWAQGASAGAAPSAAKAPAFEVISVKPTAADTPGTSIRFSPDGFSGTGVPVRFLLTEGFQLAADQLIGAPDWAGSSRWDISAKVSGEDVPALKDMNFTQRRQMFLQVLESRFGLKYHMEKRELPVYALVVAKGGLKMKETTPADGSSKGSPGKLMGRAGKIEGQGVKMEFLTTVLSNNFGRPVMDKTGLTGLYDFNLTWTPDQAAPGGGDHAAMMGPSGAQPAGDPEGGPSLVTALQEQLGLKLEPQKGMVDVVVVDQLEKPSED